MGQGQPYEDTLIRLPHVENLVGVRRSSIYAMISGGDFPKPAKIGGASRWSKKEVCEWRDARLAERHAAPS